MSQEAKWKIVLGEPYPGMARIMCNGQEIPNVTSIDLKAKPGKLPDLELTIMVPQAEIEDRTTESLPDLIEKEVSAKELPKVAEQVQKAGSRKKTV